MMEYSVIRGVACCGLLCFRVGEFGEFCTSSCFRRIRFGGGSKTRRSIPNEEPVVERFSCCNT